MWGVFVRESDRELRKSWLGNVYITTYPSLISADIISHGSVLPPPHELRQETKADKATSCARERRLSNLPLVLVEVTDCVLDLRQKHSKHDDTHVPVAHQPRKPMALPHNPKLQDQEAGVDAPSKQMFET